MHVWILRKMTFILMLILCASISIPILGQAQNRQRCFPETGFCIADRIREFWEQHGGIEVFGFPIGAQKEELIEGKLFQVQWFERNRLEIHPENEEPYDVLIGRLGPDNLSRQQRNWQTFPKSTPQPNCRYFVETGHNICGEILEHWRAHGLNIGRNKAKNDAASIGLFGLPLSDAQIETLSDGRQYVVQWFERSRFELHPENSPPFNVLLGLLGNEIWKNSVSPNPSPSNNQCTNVPDPVNGQIRPSKCIKQGDPIIIEIFNFEPGEEVGFWFTAADGSTFGSVTRVSVGEDGDAHRLPIDTEPLPPGLWSIVFQGISSKHQAIIYFKISAREGEPKPFEMELDPFTASQATPNVITQPFHTKSFSSE